MGRPRELTEEEKAELLARGFRPVEVWLPDVNSEMFWKQLEAEGKAIRESDSRTNMDQVLEAFLKDVWDDFR